MIMDCVWGSVHIVQMRNIGFHTYRYLIVVCFGQLSKELMKCKFLSFLHLSEVDIW